MNETIKKINTKHMCLKKEKIQKKKQLLMMKNRKCLMLHNKKKSKADKNEFILL